MWVTEPDWANPAAIGRWYQSESKTIGEPSRTASVPSIQMAISTNASAPAPTSSTPLAPSAGSPLGRARRAAAQLAAAIAAAPSSSAKP